LDEPLVSVIVPTRNSTRTLRACLDSIAGQTYPAVEIIVVDNHSTDDTAAIARAVTPQVLTQGPERSAQRNAGARAAHGVYFAFVDSDMVLAPTVIADCVRAAARPGIAGVIIPERSVGQGFWARCKALERSCYVGDDTIEAARFCPASAFAAAGGYDEALTGPEDWDLSRRLAKMGYIDRVGSYITHDEGRLTLWDTLQTKFYYGKSFARYIRKMPVEPAAPRSAGASVPLIRPAFARQWRRMIAQPQLAAGMILMKSAEYCAGGAGLLASTFQAWCTDETL
jgi:glycosyltransferase involved in cell wall biosynthesis